MMALVALRKAPSVVLLCVRCCCTPTSLQHSFRLYYRGEHEHQPGRTRCILRGGGGGRCGVAQGPGSTCSEHIVAAIGSRSGAFDFFDEQVLVYYMVAPLWSMCRGGQLLFPRPSPPPLSPAQILHPK